jgi:hypothetical protein
MQLPLLQFNRGRAEELIFAAGTGLFPARFKTRRGAHFIRQMASFEDNRIFMYDLKGEFETA